MDADLAEKAWSVLAFFISLAVMLTLVFGVFKLIDWARETRRMAEEALDAKSKSVGVAEGRDAE